MNYLEFAQKIKAKHPQYSDMDDRELAERIVAKYPEEYSDINFDAEGQESVLEKTFEFADDRGTGQLDVMQEQRAKMPPGGPTTPVYKEPVQALIGLEKGLGEATRQVYGPPSVALGKKLISLPGMGKLAKGGRPELREKLELMNKPYLGGHPARAPEGETQETMAKLGEFALKGGAGIALGGLVPAAGIGGAALQGAVANLPFMPKIFQEGGTKGALTDVVLNTLLDLVTFKAGKFFKALPSSTQKEVLEQSGAKSVKEIIDNPNIGKTPLDDVRFKDIGKKVKAVEQVTGDVVDVSKVKAPGMPWKKDLGESESRLLLEPPAKETIKFSEYAKQSQVKKQNIKAISPAQLAATNATKAFKEIDALAGNAGKEISKIIQDNPDATINIKGMKDDFIRLVDERIGGLTEGAVSADPSALKAAEEIANDLLSLPDNINVKDALRLKQNLRQKVKYDAAGQLRPKNTVLQGIQKNVSNQVDSMMDEVLPGFDDANKKYAEYIGLKDSFSRALGAEFGETDNLTKHGASIMKRSILSLADSNISDIFRATNRLTGGDYDLFQDAVYSNVAMRLSGDVNQSQMALPFGGVFSRKGAVGGGDITKSVGTGVKALGKIREKTTGGKLGRVVDWYEKKHGIKYKKPPLSVLGDQSESAVVAPIAIATSGGLTLAQIIENNAKQKNKSKSISEMTGVR